MTTVQLLAILSALNSMCAVPCAAVSEADSEQESVRVLADFTTLPAPCGGHMLTATIGSNIFGPVSADRIILDASPSEPGIPPGAPVKITKRDQYSPRLIEFDYAHPESEQLLARWRSAVARLLLRDSGYATAQDFDGINADPLAFLENCTSCRPDFLEIVSLPEYHDEDSNAGQLDGFGAKAFPCSRDWWKGAIGLWDGKLDCIGTTGNAPLVAIVDSQVNWKLNDLENVFPNGPAAPQHYDAVSNGAPAFEDNHGTLMARIIAGKKHGVCHKAKIVPVRVLEKSISGANHCLYHSRFEAGLKYVLDQKIPLINLSISLESSTKELNKIFETLNKAGIIIVSSAGENGWELHGQHSNVQRVFPASLGLKNVIAVTGTVYERNGGTTCVESMSSWNYSPAFVHLAAPGTFSLGSKGKGTSIATALTTSVSLSILAKDAKSNVKKSLSDAGTQMVDLRSKTQCECRLAVP